MKIKYPNLEIELTPFEFNKIDLKKLLNLKGSEKKEEDQCFYGSETAKACPDIPTSKSPSEKPKDSEKEVDIKESNAPSIVKEPILPSEKPKHTNRKITIEQIRKIKELSKDGMDSNHIAQIVDISPQLVNYWRKNTPKNI